jgi:nicotinamide-nucleotide amidase
MEADEVNGAPDPAAAEVLDVLAARGQTLAVAESLTGGQLAATIVSVPGASKAFRGGLVVYATDLKARLAGVDEALLGEVGPVDAQVAEAMAAGARARCVADWGLATTGVAGPDPQDGHPPGMAYVAVAGAAGATSRQLLLAGTRADIRTATVMAALALLAEQLGGPR